MINVLCYGDSNTYGYMPKIGGRFDIDTRWTGRLMKLLGPEYRVIEEGLNGRVTAFSFHKEQYRNGLTYLKPCLLSHCPLDYVVIMLGTNDCKFFLNQDVNDIMLGMAGLVRLTRDTLRDRQDNLPKILVVAPAAIGEGVCCSIFADECDETSIQKSKEIPAKYKEVAEKYGTLFLDANTIVKVSPDDCEHLDAEGHRVLAEAIAEIILNN